MEYMYLGIYLIGLNLYLLRLGFGPERIGIVWGCGIATYSVTSLVAGYLFGRGAVRKLVTFGVLFTLSGIVAVSLTDLLPPGSHLVWVLLVNSFAWFGGGLYGVGRIPYLAAAVPASERVQTFALERVMGIGLGFVGALLVSAVPSLAATFLGTDLDDPAPYRVTLLLAPLGQITALLLYAAASRGAPPLANHEDDEGNGPSSPIAFSPKAMIVLLSAFTVIFNFSSAPTLYFFNVYMDKVLHVSPTLIALVMGLARLGSLPVTFLLPVLSRRWPVRSMLVGIALIMSIALVPIAIIHTWVAAGLCFIVASLLLDVFEPTFDVHRIESVPVAWQTRIVGVTQTSTFGAQSIGGFAGGFVVVRLGYAALFLGAAGLALVAALLLTAGNRRAHRRVSWP